MLKGAGAAFRQPSSKATSQRTASFLNKASHCFDQGSESRAKQRGNVVQDDSKSASSINIRDFLSVKLGEGAILTIETPKGTKATIRQGSPPGGKRISWDSEEEESKRLGESSSLIISSEDESSPPKRLGGKLQHAL